MKNGGMMKAKMKAGGGMMSKMMPSGGKAMKNSAMPKKTKG
jgi:hypothetical protein